MVECRPNKEKRVVGNKNREEEARKRTSERGAGKLSTVGVYKRVEEGGNIGS